MASGRARVVTADRSQPCFDTVDLEAWLPADHRARIVWAFTGTLNLEPLYAEIGSREGEAGRPALDPRVLLALWLYATLDGVGAARHLMRLTESDLAYRWLRGGMPLNAHTLSDFRVASCGDLDRLLSESLAGFLAEGVISLEEIIVDGTKVKASAGKGSFKTAEGLAEAERLARRRVDELRREVDDDPGAGARRRDSARERAAEEAVARAAAAKAALDRLAEEKAKRARTHRADEEKKGERKASLTDPEARSMRFADGAVGPGYNVQIATTAVDGVIVAIEPTDRRNDSGLAGVMVDEVERRLGRRPDRLLVDSGYAAADDIVSLASHPTPTVVYAPVKPDRQDVSEHALRCRARQREREPEAMKAWRARMASEEGEKTMKRRKRIELVNAHLKARGFGRQILRGLAKVRAVALLHALAHNLVTVHRLRLEAA